MAEDCICRQVGEPVEAGDLQPGRVQGLGCGAATGGGVAREEILQPLEWPEGSMWVSPEMITIEGQW